ncbi:MAG TPA: endonuclease/exonuclease/phosphatase family protein [Verrucomicrobiota bacterium]|nr:endonuclease/exonuclease/phosphatase family protein [Verrucomicrobiota bacterium]
MEYRLVNRSEFLRRFVVLAGAAVAGCATQTSSKKKVKEVRVLTYNIHHCEGRDGQVDLMRTAQVIRESNSDLVALQEVDRGVLRTQGRNLPAELGALTGLTPLFANNYAFDGGEYGNAILTRFTVKRWSNLHYRPIREGEQRGLLQAVVDVDGTEVAFLNTHLDHRPDDVERLASVDEIESAITVYEAMPLILCGDFNALPGSRVYVRLSERFRDSWRVAGRGAGDTYPSEKPVKRIDYVWLRGPLQAASAEVITGDASDHAAVRVTVRLS